MDTGTITPLLKRMEQAGFVTRQRDARDERRVLVDLTPAGATMRAAIASVLAQVNAACRIIDDHVAALLGMLDEMECLRDA